MPIAQSALWNRLGARSRTGWIGIDVGSHSVKIAQLEISGGQKQIAEAVVIPIPKSEVSTVDVLRNGWLARTLRDELSHRHGFKGRKVACGLSMSVTEFRSMNIPPGSIAERREMIAQELSESGDFSSAAIEFDFWDGYCNPADVSSSEAPVNVLSVPIDVATQLAQAIQGAVLHCQVLDGGPFALARSIELMGHEVAAGQPVAVLDWGHRGAHLALIVNGQPVFSRLLKDCGVGALVVAVRRELGLSMEEAHQLLSTCGVPNPLSDRAEHTELQELVDDYSGELFDHLLGELEKTLSYLRMQRAELIPAELWLIGGGATIRNVEAKLCFEMGMPVKRWQPHCRPSASIGLESNPVELFAQAAALSELGWTS